VGTEDVPDAVRTRDRLVTNVHLIDAQVESGFVGHSYFYSHPAVSSDLILLLRHGLDPGAENGRPLEHLGGRFWRIDEDYPKVEE